MTAAAVPTTRRHEHIVWPSLTGHGTGLVARIGDWAWQSVADQTGCDVLRAETADGRPAYLSFHYYRVRGSHGFHLRTPTFGDRLTVATQSRRSGSQSVLTLHRVMLDPDGRRPATICDDSFWDRPEPGELRAEQLNRWVSHAGASNEDLVSSTPRDFDVEALAPAPDRAPARKRVLKARGDGSFRPDGLVESAPPTRMSYVIDPARDLNAVGLLYFAAYFGIVDWALGRAWQQWGRSVDSFLQRVCEDIELLYEGNADAATELEVEVRRWQGSEPGVEYVDIALTQSGRGSVAVCTQRLRISDPRPSGDPRG